MDRQPAQHLHALLSVLDPGVADPALRPLERLIARPGSGEALIVAIVGVSGVGKSEIVNELAGARVVTAGPVRPTTTEIAIWGDVDAAYLPGIRITGSEPPNDVVLVDTPAAEHYADTVIAVLDLVDAALFVISPERYADAITAALLAQVREREIPTRVVLSIDTGNVSDFAGLVDDANVKLGTPVDVTMAGDVNPLRLLLEGMAQDRASLIEQRDRAAAVFSATRTHEVAGVLEQHTVESQFVVAKADEAFARTRIDRRRLVVMAEEEWEVAAPAIAAMTADATVHAIDSLAENVAADEYYSRAVNVAAVSLLSIDQEPIDEWCRATTDLALAATKRRWFHPLRSKAVREEMWRLAMDFDRPPTKRVRKALRSRLPDLRYDRGVALTGALRDAGSARITAFRSKLDPSSRVSADDLRVAADEVAASASMPREAGDDAA